MNQDTLLQIKQKYEEKLVSALTKVLKCNPENISATWSIDKIEININLSANKDITTYNFVYTANNLAVTMSHYNVIVNSSNVIVGVEAQESTIDLNTLKQLYAIITKILTDELNLECENSNAALKDNEGVIEE